MLIKFGIPLLAAAAIGFSISTITYLTPKERLRAVLTAPAATTLDVETIAGLGEFQMAGEPIAVATALSGIVTNVFVKAGAHVSTGEPLFAVDDREHQSEMVLRQRALATAEAKLDRLKAGTRPTELPPAQARVEVATISVKRADDAWQRAEKLRSSDAMSEEEHYTRSFALQQSRAESVLAVAELAKLEAGTWSYDIAIAEQEVESARAAIDRVKVDINRLTVRSLVEGIVLHANVRAGEYAEAGPLAAPLIQLGTNGALQVRVQVDEEDASRIESGAAAEGFLRGRVRVRVPLKFVRIEPRVVPKTSLTGMSTERVDTRVLYVVYEAEGPVESAYAGQKLDVFIKSRQLPSKNY